MAALMIGRVRANTYRHLARLVACQSPQLTYCQRKHFSHIQKCQIQNIFAFRDFIASNSRCYSKVLSTPSPADETGSAKQSENDKTTDNASKHNWKVIGITVLCAFWGLGLVLLIVEWGKPQRDMDGNVIEDEYSESNAIYAHIMRTYREIFFQVKVTQEPSREKLLPDPLSYPYIQPPYTLVLEMKDVLVHGEWGYATGWRFSKRPGLDYFLKAVGPPTFEVVIYTQESGMTADPIVTQIDPENYIMYRLYRDATRYQNGVHIKDLNCLNRDLSRVIMIDCNEGGFKLNPENALKLKKWEGTKNDTTLGELAEFLNAIAVSGVDDVRPVLTYYSQFEDPMAKFHENQMRLKEEQDRLALQQKQKQSSTLTNAWNKFRI